ncbi:MAG: hypothetical protein LBS12_01530, partial [Prevotellaceae bacterium]|nr:hypothetical protein [Prevotellaceae bacterium]
MRTVKNTGVVDENTGVVAPNTGVVAPTTGVVAPNTGVVASNTGVVAPNTGVVAPNTGVFAPTTPVFGATTPAFLPKANVIPFIARCLLFNLLIIFIKIKSTAKTLTFFQMAPGALKKILPLSDFAVPMLFFFLTAILFLESKRKCESALNNRNGISCFHVTAHHVRKMIAESEGTSSLPHKP